MVHVMSVENLLYIHIKREHQYYLNVVKFYLLENVPIQIIHILKIFNIIIKYLLFVIIKFTLSALTSRSEPGTR